MCNLVVQRILLVAFELSCVIVKLMSTFGKLIFRTAKSSTSCTQNLEIGNIKLLLFH